MRVECLSEVRAEGRIRPKSSQARRAESAAPASPAAAKCADPIVFVASCCSTTGAAPHTGVTTPVSCSPSVTRNTTPSVAHPWSLATPPPQYLTLGHSQHPPSVASPSVTRNKSRGKHALHGLALNLILLFLFYAAHPTLSVNMDVSA
eukprot:1196176-Prorocentrum_minimum.AAC.2